MRPPAGRLVAVFASFAIGLIGVAARLVVLQVRDASAFEALARDQRIREIPLPAARGTIYDRNVHVLALSLPAKAIYADPRQIDDPGRVARELAPALGEKEGVLRRALASDTSFVYLARRADLDVARRVRSLALPGIGFLDESKRHYPGEDLAAHVLGYVGIDDTALAGLELQHDRLLQGRDGSMLIEQDPSGNAIPQGMRRVEDPLPGRDVVLSLDGDLQFQTEEALADAVRANGAKGGMAIVMDPRTGEILAMAIEPRFDANAFAETPQEHTANRALTHVYEPGSVNKVITASAALEEGVVGLRETFGVPDRYRVSDHVFHDAHRHPPMTMTLTDIIAESSNVGTIMTAQRVGKETLDRYLRRFGFGEPTGVGFPGEAAGILPAAEAWWGTSMGTIPIGQGVAVTPLQMTSVYATIANDGVWVRPTLVRGTLEPDGSIAPLHPAEERRIISRRTARAVTGMLARAVAAGTGEAAQIPRYWVAGKTGTARKPLEGGLGYSNRHVASFMGFLPAGQPQLVVAAILDEPVTVYGGVAAAPLFREIARFAIAHLRIPPAGRPWIPPLASEAGR